VRGPRGIAVTQAQADTRHSSLLVSDRSQDNRDRYGRLLRYVETRDTDINKLQIRRGWAHVYVSGGNPFKRVEKYRKAQRAAKQRNLGVWRERGGNFRA